MKSYLKILSMGAILSMACLLPSCLEAEEEIFSVSDLDAHQMENPIIDVEKDYYSRNAKVYVTFAYPVHDNISFHYKSIYDGDYSWKSVDLKKNKSVLYEAELENLDPDTEYECYLKGVYYYIDGVPVKWKQEYYKRFKVHVIK